MLVIRNAQMHALQGGREALFIERLVAHLQTHCTSATRGVDGAELRQRAERAVARGRELGLRTERDLVKFTALLLVYGGRRRFGKEPAELETFLRDHRVPLATDRLQRLQAHLIRRFEIQANNRRILREAGLEH